MTGVNGVTSKYKYPRTRFRLRIGDVETGVLMGAIGGDTSVLVGRDVLVPLGDLGYSVRGRFDVVLPCRIGECPEGCTTTQRRCYPTGCCTYRLSVTC